MKAGTWRKQSSIRRSGVAYKEPQDPNTYEKRSNKSRYHVRRAPCVMYCLPVGLLPRKARISMRARSTASCMRPWPASSNAWNAKHNAESNEGCFMLQGAAGPTTG